MKKPVLLRRGVTALCIVMCVVGGVKTFAQQRYFAISMVNENDNPGLESITKAKEIGFNAVALTVQWGSIHGKLSRILRQENGDGYNVWSQYDKQIQRALSLNMKVAINIAVSTGDDKTNSTTDRYGIDTGDGWKKEDRVVVANYNGEEAVFQKQGGPIRPGVNLQFVMTSLAAQSTRERITSFTSEVIQRYKHLQTSGNLLYTNLIYTRQGEGEFEVGSTKYHYEQYLDLRGALTDYSQPMTSAYRSWLIGKYGYIGALNSAWGTSYSSFNQVGPKRPSNNTFTGPDGYDWVSFRTQVLKDINNLFKNTVKGIDPGIKVISHHGSVYDRLSRQRGTLPFGEIGADLDGIKINDDIHYDHRFALDLVRSNLPDRFYVNEAAYVTGMGSVTRLTQESFDHGANMVTMFYFENAIQSESAVNEMKSLANNYVNNKQVTRPSAGNNDSFTLSNMLDRDGCATNRDSWGDDCDAYRNWRSAYNNAGSKPVNIFMVNDVLAKGCFYKDLTLAGNGTQASATVPSNKDFNITGPGCKILGTVKGEGLSSGDRQFTASVQIDSEVKSRNSQPYVQRHYHFNAASGQASARVTLYVSGDEFRAFNNVSTVKLPANSSDNLAKDNIRILRITDSTPASSMGTVINPDDNDIQWDSVLGLWKISFTTNGFSSFYITADKAGPLPVTLVSFSAAKQETSATLSWETSEEINSDHFEIQHSLSGKNWSAIGRMSSASEGRVAKNYTFNHNKPSKGSNLYRLKMVDKDSTFAYSKIVSVEFDRIQDNVVLFPNPAVGGIISLSYTDAKPVVTLSDMNGRPVLFNAEQTEPGKLILRPGGKLSSGLYILKTSVNGQTAIHKVVVAN